MTRRKGDRQIGSLARRLRRCHPRSQEIRAILTLIDLHWFEKKFSSSDGPGSWATAKLVRYADDFVVLARYQSPRLVNWVERLLEGRFQLTVNREKTRIVKPRKPGQSL